MVYQNHLSNVHNHISFFFHRCHCDLRISLTIVFFFAYCFCWPPNAPNFMPPVAVGHHWPFPTLIWFSWNVSLRTPNAQPRKDASCLRRKCGIHKGPGTQSDKRFWGYIMRDVSNNLAASPQGTQLLLLFELSFAFKDCCLKKISKDTKGRTLSWVTSGMLWLINQPPLT